MSTPATHAAFCGTPQTPTAEIVSSPSTASATAASAVDLPCRCAELHARVKLLEQELYAAERYPKVGPFVKSSSHTWLAVKEAGSCWILSLPLERFPWERCLALLDLLAKLQDASDVDGGAEPGLEKQAHIPRIFNVRKASLWAVLDAATDADIGDMLELTEFLQFPKALSARLMQQRAAVRLRTAGPHPSLDTGLTGTHLDVSQDAVLGPLFKDGLSTVGRLLKVVSDESCDPPHRARRMLEAPSALWDGLLGTPVDLCRTGFDAKALPLYVLGLELAKHNSDNLSGTPAPLAPLRPLDDHPDYDLAIGFPMVLAAVRDDPIMAERLLGRGFPLTAHAIQTAAEVDAAAFVAWAHHQGCKCDDLEQYIAATSSSHKVLLFLRDSGVRLNVWATAGAGAGRIETLQMLRSPQWNCPWDGQVTTEAAARGSLEILQWARAQDPPCPWSASVCSSAALHGNLEVLQWLRAQVPPCPWSADSCEVAARCGNLETLQWLRSQAPPCPWGPTTCLDAAVGGKLEVLKWLRAQVPPCPWDSRVLMNAKSEEIRAWARANGCPEPAEGDDEDENEDGENEDEGESDGEAEDDDE